MFIIFIKNPLLSASRYFKFTPTLPTPRGGVARALLRDGEEFYQCADVPAITLASVADAEFKTVTGWVRAVYGGVQAGDEVGDLLDTERLLQHVDVADPFVGAGQVE